MILSSLILSMYFHLEVLRNNFGCSIR